MLFRSIAGTAPFIEIQKTLNFSLNFEGVEVTWDNIYDGEYYVVMNYTDALNVENRYELVIDEKGKGRRKINVGGVLETDLYFTVGDYYANVSESVAFRFKKLEQGQFDRSIWRIVDFKSEEAGGEVYPNGYANALLDGAANTFWHSRWANLPEGYVVGYPYWVTFDLQRKVQLDSAEYQQRHNNAMAGAITLEGSNTSALGPWDPINVTTMTVSNGFKKRVPFDQSYFYRYVKMSITKPGGGNQAHAALAEFVLFGQDIVDE